MKLNMPLLNYFFMVVQNLTFKIIIYIITKAFSIIEYNQKTIFFQSIKKIFTFNVLLMLSLFRMSINLYFSYSRKMETVDISCSFVFIFIFMFGSTIISCKFIPITRQIHRCLRTKRISNCLVNCCKSANVNG